MPPVEDRRPLAVDVGAGLRHPARYAPPGGSRFLGPACPDGLSFASVSGSAQNFSGVFCGPDSPLFPFLDGGFHVYPLLLCFGELHRDMMLFVVPCWMICPFSFFCFVPCTITPSFGDPFTLVFYRVLTQWPCRPVGSCHSGFKTRWIGGHGCWP